MSQISPYVLIDLNKYKSNIENIRINLSQGTKIMLIVKANAYGHGSVYLTKFAERLGVDYFGVANLDEALELRKNGVKSEILILGAVHPDQFLLIKKNNLIATVQSEYMIEQITKEKINMKVHLKIDTGLSRNGIILRNVQDIENISSAIRKLKGAASLCGLYTHFANADNFDCDYTDVQFSLFNNLLIYLKDNNINYGFAHCANSAAFLSRKYTHLDMVRIGLLSYGVNPITALKFQIEPIMSLIGIITQIKDVSRDEYVGYGLSFKATRNMKIAVVNIGYADGLDRALSNNSFVLVNGEMRMIVGRISMDVSVIDVSDLNVKLYDKVTFIGESGNLSINVNFIANKLNTIPYEIMCGIGKRVLRRYILEGIEL